MYNPHAVLWTLQIEDYSLVKFHPLDVSDEDSISDLQLSIDNAIQYGEDAEPREEKEYDGGGRDEEDVIERFTHEVDFGGGD